MTFGAAAVIVLAVSVIALGLLAYHLFSRLHVLEEAVAGGLRTPSRTLSREEFARRFTIARHRATFASEVGTGVVLVVDDSPASHELRSGLAHLGTSRGFSLAFAEATPPSWQSSGDFQIQENLGPRLDLLGVSVVPFCFVVDEARILEARPVGSSAALESLLLEVA